MFMLLMLAKIYYTFTGTVDSVMTPMRHAAYFHSIFRSIDSANCLQQIMIHKIH